LAKLGYESMDDAGLVSPMTRPESARRAARAIAALLLACLGLGAALPARAEDARPLRACVIDEPPWGDDQQPEHGIYPEILKTLSARLGVPIGYAPTPLARTLFEVESGSCDFTITSWDKARSDRVTPGAVMAYLDYGVLGRRDLALRSYDDLHRATVAVPRGLMIGEPFDHDPAIDKLPVANYEQAMRMVEEGRVDAALGSFVTLERIARLHGTRARFGPPLRLARIPLALQMNKDFAGTPRAAELERAVTALRQSGEADAVIARHFADAVD
jgi:polar amino acid transport system substrate-binding protein